MSLLELRNVTAAYGGTVVLRDVSLSVDPGELAVLLGRNGAGKTTLTRLAMRLHEPEEGEILIDGVSVAGKRPEELADRVGYQFQHVDRELFARTVEEELAFGPRQQKLSKDEIEGRVSRALSRTGLTGLRRTHPHDLAPAQKKLLGIAIALSQDPMLYVLDEPTQGLDRETSVVVGGVLREELDRGKAVLMVTHDLQFVADFADRVIVLDGGTVRYSIPAAEFFAARERLALRFLRWPPSAEVSHSLALEGRPWRTGDVVNALKTLLNQS